MSDTPQQEIVERITAFKEKFHLYNRTKLNTLHALIPSAQTISLLEAIPFFLSVNQPGLPGHIDSAEVPVGLHNFSVGGKAQNFIRGLFPSSRVAISARPGKPFIQMFALMGSCGTIAYTSSSDFDFWICADEEDVTPEAARLFRMKCRAVENWIAERYNLEVHFFLNDIGKVKRNIFDEDTDGSFSGTSLGELLKEEFLRSSIVLGGKIPFWWVVPAGADDRTYAEWLEAARESRLAGEFVDLGNLSTIGREDFLVAALFQLLKSLGNPFKSIIKLGLLERYIHGRDGSPFISTIIKDNVHRGEFAIDSIDSYVIMFNHVYDFYSAAHRDAAAMEILETSFYLKVDPGLSAVMRARGPESAQPKTRKMLEYVKKWNWSESIITQMDNFENLDIDTVNRLLNDTKKHILRGYKDVLGAIQTEKITGRLAARELQGITRQIHSHFSMAENKIDNTLSFKSYPPEKLLHVAFVRDRDGKEFWILSKRVIVRNYPTEVIIHKESTLIGIAVWISLNKLFQKDFTRLEIDAGIHPVDPNFLRGLIAELTQHFSIKRLDLHSGYFLKESFPVMSYIIINPLTKYSKKIEEILFLFHNSWGETRFERHGGESDIPRVVTAVLNGALRTGLDFDRALRLVSSQPYGSSREFDRISSLLRDMHGFFIDGQSGVRKRYVAPMANLFFVFSTTRAGGEEIIACTPFDSELKLLYGLSYNTGAMNRVRIAPDAPELNYLGKIIENSRGDAVQIYVQKGSKYCYFFVSDERGSVIFFRKAAELYGDYLARLHLFALAAVREVTARNPNSPLAGSPRAVQLYKIDRGASHSVRITEVDPELDPEIKEARKRAQPFRLSLHQLASGETGYRFTLPDGSCTNVYTRANMLQVIGDLRLLMRSVRGYSFHASDIDLSQLKAGPQTASTSFAFTGKNTFELLVEKGVGSARDVTKNSPSR